ncbi:MAG: O-methyltransferase [Tannerellaceae bacterium]|jgi:predicted O-methyltransferase YrrM|nr:O-methyltransferase [Tannerellaceae bacterium]
MNPLDEYILSHTDPQGELLEELTRDAHVNLLRPRMIAGHMQGRILKMLCRVLRPRRIVEIGTYTGYATLCMAEGIDDDALIHTIEIDEEMEDFMMKYIQRSPHKDKIKVHFGDAIKIIPSLGEEVLDMVFIDADKRLYANYYDLVFPYLRPGGVIVADNTLWDGKVAAVPKPADKQTTGIMNFNDKVKDDPRIEKVILPLRDGLTIIWKK